jgi:hypothetical protein
MNPHPNIVFLQTPGTIIPVGDASVDIINMELLLQHCPMDVQISYLKEASKKLVLGGLLIAQIPQTSHSWNGFVEADLAKLLSSLFTSVFIKNNWYLNTEAIR